jgi:GNAT superfamily N-acetyltransferase
MHVAGAVGVLAPFVGGTYYGSLVAGVGAAADRHGRRLIAIQTLDAAADLAVNGGNPAFDAPVAWDHIAGFVVLADAADTHARGQGFLVAVVEHVPTGTLVAFSEVRHPRARPAVVLQGDTLVLREHRGHGLGMLAKLAVLDALAVTRPDAERIHTWNAQENDHMLAINVALGFRQASVDAEWQRDL